jgi:K+-transporting ATPase ATPase C chain
MLLVLTILTGVVYPLVVTGVAQTMFEPRADGSLVTAGGRVVGSEFLGQGFAAPEYFHPRPSAGDYDGAASGGSNLGPTSAEFLNAVDERARAFRQENGLPADELVPIDAVTASGSGLDPHITPANALLQAGRVSRERSLPLDEVTRLIVENTASRGLGFLGEPAVNILLLNLALDEIS